jgi:Uma2 family endonuclease
MVELRLGPNVVDLPFTVRIPDVTEEMFDELVDEDTNAELLDGVMIVHSPASLRHDDLGGFLRMLMRGFAEEKTAGRVLGPDSLVRLAPGCKFAPDIYFLEKRRVPARWKGKQFEGAPDLVVEVLSPSNRDDDLKDKWPAYRKAGVSEIWFVDYEKEVVIVDHKRKRGYGTTHVDEGNLHSTVLTGFWIDVDWLWEEALPGGFACLRQILPE